MNSLEQSLTQLKQQYESSQQRLVQEFLVQSLNTDSHHDQLERLLSRHLISTEQYEKYVVNLATISANIETTNNAWILKWNDKQLRESIINNMSTAFQCGMATSQDFEDYRIVVCKKEHLDPLVPLFVGYMQFYDHPISNSKAKEYLTRVWNSDAVILVACTAQSPIGFVVMYPMFECEILERFWLLNDMFVDANWRKNNIGAALMEQAKRVCMDSGGKKLYLETLKDNQAAQNFYRKHGFVPDQVHMTWHLDFE